MSSPLVQVSFPRNRTHNVLSRFEFLPGMLFCKVKEIFEKMIYDHPILTHQLLTCPCSLPVYTHVYFHIIYNLYKIVSINFPYYYLAFNDHTIIKLLWLIDTYHFLNSFSSMSYLKVLDISKSSLIFHFL